MSVRKALICLAILIMLACVADLLVDSDLLRPGYRDFVVFWKPWAPFVLFTLGLSLGADALNRRSKKKADLYRARMAEQKAAEEEQRAAEEARLKALPTLINCPACNKEISREAAACPSCGHPINPIVQAPPAPPTPETLQRSWSPGIAALLSLIIPGAGQIYKGQVGGGLLWLLFVVGGYVLFIFPGVILHLICIFSAASGKK